MRTKNQKPNVIDDYTQFYAALRAGVPSHLRLDANGPEEVGFKVDGKVNDATIECQGDPRPFAMECNGQTTDFPVTIQAAGVEDRNQTHRVRVNCGELNNQMYAAPPEDNRKIVVCAPEEEINHPIYATDAHHVEDAPLVAGQKSDVTYYLAGGNKNLVNYGYGCTGMAPQSTQIVNFS